MKESLSLEISSSVEVEDREKPFYSPPRRLAREVLPFIPMIPLRKRRLIRVPRRVRKFPNDPYRRIV